MFVKISTFFSASVAFLCCISPLSHAIESNPAVPVSFSNAWQFVSEHSNALKAQQANVESTRAKQEAAKDLYLPNISLDGTYTHLDKEVELDTNIDISGLADAVSVYGLTLPTSLPIQQELTEQDIFTSSITTVWPLFTGGRIDAAQIVAQGATDEAKALLKMKQQERFETLSKVYFGTILAKQVAQTYVEVELAMEAHYEHARKLEEQGQIAHVEKLSAQAQYDTAKVNTIKAKKALEIAQVALNQMLREKNDTVSSYLPDSNLFINKSLPAFEIFMQQTLDTYPGLDVLDAKEKQVGGLIQAEKGRYMPTVAAFGSYNLYEDDSLTSDLVPDWYVGMNVSMDLLDSSGRGGDLDAAYQQKIQVAHLRTQALRDLHVLVERTYKSAQQSLDEYNGLKSSESLAQENIRLRELAFAQGMSTSVQVSDAQTFLQTVKTRRLSAAYQYVVNLCQLLALSGEINTFSNYQNSLGIEVQ